MTSQQAVSNSFFLVHFLSKYKTFFGGVHVQNFMAFTGNFYDWIWFCWSPNWFDLFLPSDRAFYINGVRMALFFSTLEHDSVSWIFRQFWPEKRGDFEKKKEGLWLQTLFRLIGKQGKSEEGETKPPVSIREKMPILWLFYFLMLSSFILASQQCLIDWYHFKLITWIIPGQLHTPFVVSWKKSIDFWLSALHYLKAIIHKDHKI